MELIYAWEAVRERGLSGCPARTRRGPIAFLSSSPIDSSAPSSTSSPTPDSKQPVEVKLQPTAKVHGKVVTDNGSPAEGGQVSAHDRMGRPKEGEMTRSEILGNTEFYANLMGQKAMLAYVTKILEPKPRASL